jgi:hypothetical protein
MKRTIVLLASLGGLGGCGTGPDRQDMVGYFFYMTASAADTTAERIRTHGCTVNGSFQLPNPAPANGTVRFALTLNRNLMEESGRHFENTLADTSVAEAVLQYAGLGDNELSFTLGAGPYTISPPAGTPNLGEAGSYSGLWSCGPDFPLAQDSTLGAYGLDPTLQLDGVWTVQEIRPID